MFVNLFFCRYVFWLTAVHAKMRAIRHSRWLTIPALQVGLPVIECAADQADFRAPDPQTEPD